MKKLLLFILAFVILITPVFATDQEAIDNEVETISTTTSIISIAGIGVALVSALVLFFTKFGWLKRSVSAIVNAFSVIFGKGGKIENIPQALEDLKKEYDEAKAQFTEIYDGEKARFEELKLEFEKQNKENNEFRQAFALLCIYANNINPYIKNEIYRLIKGETPFKETIDETAKEILERAEQVQDSEPMIVTPCLKDIVKE